MNRREFSRLTGLSALAMHAIPAISSASIAKPHDEVSLNIPLGVGNHSLRGMRPNAKELIVFAIEHKLDSVQYNTLTVFESFEDEYWKGFPDLKAAGITDFLKLVRMGHPLEIAVAPPGADKKAFDMENQKNDLLRSIKYLREVCGAGLS